VGTYGIYRRVDAEQHARGGQGETFLAYSPAGTPVMIKTPHRPLTEDVRRHFVREAETLERLRGLSAPTFLQAELEGETPWFALKYYPWPTLEQYHQAKGKMPVARAVVLARQMMEFLGQLETKGILHLDLKPKNLLVGPSEICVIDFGASKLADTQGRVHEDSLLYFSSGYVAPERGNVDALTIAADVFSAARTLVFATTGRPDADPVREIGGELGDLLRRCLSIEVDSRPSPGQALHELNRINVTMPTGQGGEMFWDTRHEFDRHRRDPRSGDQPVAADVGTAAAPPPTPNTTTVTAAPLGDPFAERRAQAGQLLAQGYAFDRQGQHVRAVPCYTEAVAVYERHADPGLRPMVAMALNNKRWSLYRMNKHADAIATCAQIVETFGDDLDPVLRQQVAMALNASGQSKRELGAGEQAVADWAEVVSRYGGDPDLVLRQQVAMALRDQGLILASLDRRAEALSAYTRLIESFQGDADLVLRQQVAMALNNRRSFLYKLGHQAEAAAMCTRLVEIFGGDRDKAIRQQVAVALLSKGLILNKSRQHEGAIAAYGRLVDIFEADADPWITDTVRWARGRLSAR
jgi:tetratricopeptide (TPR) repeat protein